MKKYARKLSWAAIRRLKQYQGKWIPANQTQNLPRVHQEYRQKRHLQTAADSYISEALQDACVACILYFFEKNWEELLKFSRRTQNQLEQWAARYGYKDHPREILDHAKKGGGKGRYSCVNLQNRDTIEFRMFRGTLKYNTLIATLQLVDRVCEVALNLRHRAEGAVLDHFRLRLQGAGAGAVSEGAAALCQ